MCQLTGAQLQIAQAIGVNPANIVLTFSFTTESTLDTLQLVSATTAAQTLAVQHPPGFTTAAIPGLGLPGHADVYVGVLTVPYYLSKSAPLTEYWHAPPFPLDTTSTLRDALQSAAGADADAADPGAGHRAERELGPRRDAAGRAAGR